MVSGHKATQQRKLEPMSYDDPMIEDIQDGALCPYCKEWHSPDGTDPESEDYCQREG